MAADDDAERTAHGAFGGRAGDDDLGSFGADKNLRLVSRLGHGGMADLFLGVQRGEQGFTRLVVVKKIRAPVGGLTSDPGNAKSEPHLVGMFFDEAKTVAALSHPHIVKVFDLLREEGAGSAAENVAIVMEYVDGETLSYVWRQLTKNQAPMPVSIAVKLVLDAAEALGAAHNALAPDGTPLRLIHRDVSPQNLMIDRNGYLKVIDFGIAKTTHQTELTSPGGIKGKIAYLAPECFRTRDIDARVDVYGLGLVLWELLTLRTAVAVPPDAPLGEIIEMIDGLRLKPVSSFRDDVSPDLDEVIALATHSNRDARFASMEHFASALRHACPKTASSTSVKRWFTGTFTHRLEKRRAFEADAFARAELPLPPTATTTTATSATAPLLAPPQEARTQTPATEVRAPAPVLRKRTIAALLAAGAGLAGVVLIVVVSLRGEPASVVTPPPIVVVPVVAPVIAPTPTPTTTTTATTTDPVNAATDDDLPSTPDPTPTKKPTPTTKKPTTTPTLEPPEPPPAEPPPPPPPLTPNPTTTTTTATPAAPKKPTLVSGDGSFSGAQVLSRGCTRCHAVDVRAKTRRQWERFFERDVHDRYARLDELFSTAEQERALQVILTDVDVKNGSSGIAGVR